MDLSFAPAKPHEQEVCLRIIKDGVAAQKKAGFCQWTDEYPGMTEIDMDIRDKAAYLLQINGAYAGYVAIVPGSDPAYAGIEGEWLQPEPCVTIHRLAVATDFAGTGTGGLILRMSSLLCAHAGYKSIRVDTDASNAAMLRLLERHGFKKAGIVHFQNAPKVALEKALQGRIQAG